MTAIAVLELAKEVLRLINNLYEDQPPAQRRASSLWWWNVVLKPLVMPALSEAQRKQIEAIEEQALK
jgi:hypothetical protein